MKGMKIMFLVMIGSILIASLWNAVPIIKNTVHFIFDPSLGGILKWNITLGMFIITLGITFITSLVQKYGTDQETLREIKKEQKILQQEMKKYKNNPEKMLELNKKQLEFVPRTMDLSMRPLIYTFVPFILLLRWFIDYFSTPAMEGFRFFGFLSWFWFYLIFSIVFSSIWRKVLKVA
jgi:uncharacterized membrane protein (DUF106 family)